MNLNDTNGLLVPKSSIIQKKKKKTDGVAILF